jgi:hypothetical protein
MQTNEAMSIDSVLSSNTCELKAKRLKVSICQLYRQI